ncbi:MAG: cell division protein FtsL [Spirochaetales bacterium]|nr:cell division protein FtsL [Spirochaetales bacterium]
MKKIIIIFLTLIVPLMFFLEVWGVFSNQKIVDDIDRLETEQNEWLEKNKKLIAAIAVYSSPERIEKVVRENLDLIKIEPHRMTEIILMRNK